MQTSFPRLPSLNTFVTQIHGVYATQGIKRPKWATRHRKARKYTAGQSDNVLPHAHQNSWQSIFKITSRLWHFSNLHSLEAILILQYHTKWICPSPHIYALPTFKYGRNSPKISRGLQFANFFLSLCKQLKRCLGQLLWQTYICLP